MASVAYQMYLKNKNKEKISLFPKKPLRDFVYVKDVVSANIYAWENFEKLKGILLNIVLFVSAVMLYISLIYTQSRGGYMGFFVGLFLFFLLIEKPNRS